ncbi:MAG: fibronectin type III domain-containing protein, partial [Tepidisphaeraceae bacterium]
RATGASATTVGMNWVASSDNVGVAGYDIYRGGAKIATVSGTTTSYTDTGLAPSTTYVYTVRAFDAAGNVSSSSNTDSGTTHAGTGIPADTSAPSKPGTLRATGASATTVGMNWIASSDNVGVAGYDIYRDGAKVATVSGTTTTYTDTGLTPSTAYVYTMRAFDAAGNVSSSSNADTGTTLAPAAG